MARNDMKYGKLAEDGEQRKTHENISPVLSIYQYTMNFL